MLFLGSNASSDELQRRSSSDEEPLLPFAISEPNEATNPSQKSFAAAIDEHPIATATAIMTIGWIIALYGVYPFPLTTVPIFCGLCIGLVTWTILQMGSVCHRYSKTENFLVDFSASSRRPLLLRLTAVVITICICLFGLRSRQSQLPILHPRHLSTPEKYFIGANLHDSELVLDQWKTQLLLLVDHLGKDNVFISIVESYSTDRTKEMLREFDLELSKRSIPHFINTTDDFSSPRWWPYGTAPERIDFLAKLRNQVLIPLQSPDDSIRLRDWTSFTKIVFYNDIYYKWQDVVRLLSTRLDGNTSIAGDYDLACAMDYGWSGFYDSWVARDVCGTPFRAFWPFVKDIENQKRVRNEQPFEVASCWNGMVVMQADPLLYKKERRLQARGWRMLDDANYTNSIMSPALSNPLQFRGPSTPACDHSECFLFSYDLHRLYAGKRRPRIYVNPAVKVAYDANWYRWHTTVLEIPIVKLWSDYIDRRFLTGWLIDWLLELLVRRRDYCTWKAFQLPERCDALAGPPNMGWGNG